VIIGIKGGSGEDYVFSLCPTDQTFYAFGAVYVMLSLRHNEGVPWYMRIYVGETGDMSAHFSSHPKRACFAEHDVDRIGVHLDGSERSRKIKVADILNRGNWPCND
jgi:hypothetical protein